jgi:hypothetical protein
MWGASGASLLYATTAALTISNSILGGATTLFGGQVVTGDFNVVWGTAIGATYATFSPCRTRAMAGRAACTPTALRQCDQRGFPPVQRRGPLRPNLQGS